MIRFRAKVVLCDEEMVLLGFANQEPAIRHDRYHYFLIQANDEPFESGPPGTMRVYTEIDDQAGGRYDGLESVALSRDVFDVRFKPEAGGPSRIRVAFEVGDEEFRRMRAVLRRIMRGHEAALSLADEECGR